MKLNPQQQAAVTYLDGPLLVLAGAGSGKTGVITRKMHHLIENCGYRPNSICAVTFTNKAANEMRIRVANVLPAEKRRGLKAVTFHTLGLSLLKKHAKACGLKPGFSIFDAQDCLQLLAALLPSGKASDKDALRDYLRQISHWKNQLFDEEAIVKQNLDGSIGAEMVELYLRYQQSLRAYNAVDFDDLIYLPVKLLQSDNEALEFWQNRFRHLLIDEYQDSNESQYQFVRLLAGVQARFTVVGDDDQSIYAWRGARPENLAQLQQDYPNLKVIKLEQNYRSTSRILHAANMLIANNSHLFVKKLWSELGHGEALRVLCCGNEQDEAEQVVADLISHKLRHARQYGDYAILYRGNHQSRLFEKILRDHGIGYRISGGQSWFSRIEIKDIFAYLKLICNEDDDAAFLRAVNTPKRGIGVTSLEALGKYAQQQGRSLYACASHMALNEWLSDKPKEALQQFKNWLEAIKQRLQSGNVVEILREMVQECSYEAHLYENTDAPMKAERQMENVNELIDWIGRLLEKNAQQTLADVINKLILIDILEQNDEQEADLVQMLTLHASKGLEFPFVYLVGMEEELLPHRVSIDNDQIEEERRLAYVGVTRAQKELTFSLARKRRRAGEWQTCLPSRFLEELPKDSLEWYGKNTERNEEKSKALASSHLSGLKQLLQEG